MSIFVLNHDSIDDIEMSQDQVDSLNTLPVDEVVHDQICHSDFHKLTMLLDIFILPRIKINVAHLNLLMNV